jgi:hypothetical protein
MDIGSGNDHRNIGLGSALDLKGSTLWLGCHGLWVYVFAIWFVPDG